MTCRLHTKRHNNFRDYRLNRTYTYCNFGDEKELDLEKLKAAVIPSIRLTPKIDWLLISIITIEATKSGATKFLFLLFFVHFIYLFFIISGDNRLRSLRYCAQFSAQFVRSATAAAKHRIRPFEQVRIISAFLPSRLTLISNAFCLAYLTNRTRGTMRADTNLVDRQQWLFDQYSDQQISFLSNA